MSYKALLFCPDEKIVRAVTQVLSELDFTVEPAGDVFNTAKKLADEHFDALVVESQNEKDASVLFKAARNSSVNHSSLYVAVVEGQTGVATAFRIGANLVLTKPINIEQSKGTLRVARGLLRKNEARAAAAAPLAGAANNKLAVPSNNLAVPSPKPDLHASAPEPTPMRSAGAPFSMIEVENEPSPAAEAAEVAVLESLPDPVAGKHLSTTTTSAPEFKSSAEPIAASTATSFGGQGAAVAMAPIKPAVELKTAAPLATHEPIVADASSPQPFELPAAPTFSSYADASQAAGSKSHALRNITFLALFCAAGYFAWQKFQPTRYLHGSDSAQEKSAESSAPVTASPTAQEDQISNSVNGSASAATATSEMDARPVSAVHSVPDHYVAPETIDVGDTSAAKPNITVTPKPKPIVVKTEAGSATVTPTQATPPAITIASGNPDAAVAKLMTTDAVVPKPALSSLRVSQGVSQGLLVKKVSPIYPPTALQLRKQGPVELMATISKQGTISTIKVLSGDSSLAKSASDAVRQWKYRPYLLNGEPVDIQTQVTINFKLPN
jgi:TonB family protein